MVCTDLCSIEPELAGPSVYVSGYEVNNPLCLARPAALFPLTFIPYWSHALPHLISTESLLHLTYSPVSSHAFACNPLSSKKKMICKRY